MNQVKSNLASSPARLARLVTRISSPVQLGGERRQRLDDRPAALDGLRRVLEQHALAVALREDHGPAPALGIVDEGERRQRHQQEPLGTRTDQLRLEPDLLRRQKQVRHAWPVARRPAELMHQMCRLGSDVVQAGEQTQCREPAVVADRLDGRSRPPRRIAGPGIRLFGYRTDRSRHLWQANAPDTCVHEARDDFRRRSSRRCSFLGEVLALRPLQLAGSMDALM